MTTRTVIFDRIGYLTGEEVDDPVYPGRKVAVSALASRGDVITLSADEADRLDALGATQADELDTLTGQDDLGDNSPSNFADGDGARTAPAEEVAAVAGIVDQGDAADFPQDSSASPAAEVEAAAGFGQPLGHDLHDNTRAAGLSAFLGGTPLADAEVKPIEEDRVAPTADVADLTGMKVEDLLAYLTQHPDEVDRVEEANEARARGASTQVTAAVEAVRSHQE